MAIAARVRGLSQAATAKIAIYQSTMQRSRIVCDAMYVGLRRVGVNVVLLSEDRYVRGQYQVAVFYGLTGRLREILKHHPTDGGTAVYIDLGYWGRRDGGRFAGHHKISVNSRHPTAYFQTRSHGGDRAKRFDLKIKPYGEGRHIVLAGMGPKAAEVEGFQPLQWELAAIEELKRHTERPIIYRPKPNHANAKPIEGVDFSPGTQELEEVLVDCHAVVTHHSNVAVDGLLAGVPAFVLDGVATPMGLQNFAEIENPFRPDGREQWVNDIAYTQWNVEEMRCGLPWLHLRDEGLIPC